MSKFHVIDTISKLGCSNGENEDCFGWNRSAVFVIDAATPLGPPLITPPHSDAAWLVEFARDFFVRELSSNSAGPETVRSLNKAARDYFFAHVHQEVEPCQYPAAGFQALRILEEGLETLGLADCVLFVQDAQNERRSGDRLITGQEGSPPRPCLRQCARLEDWRGLFFLFSSNQWLVWFGPVELWATR